MQAECEAPEPYKVLLLALRPRIDGGRRRGEKEEILEKVELVVMHMSKLSYFLQNSSCPSCPQD